MVAVVNEQNIGGLDFWTTNWLGIGYLKTI